MPDELPVTAEALAGWLGISTTAVLTHAKAGHVVKLARGKYDLRRSILAYCAHLRAVASGRAGEDEQLSLAAERARLAKEQADGHEIKNRIARGELVEVAEAEREWCDVLRAVRSTMLAVPSRVRQRLGSLSVAEVEVIDREIRHALEEGTGEIAESEVQT